MPIHDWTKVRAGLFHHFHQDWTIEIARALNRGRLPKGISALVQQRSGPRESDVLGIEKKDHAIRTGGSALATIEKPAARIVRRTQRELYARRANRILIQHHLGRTVAVIEIVSPGNKDRRSALRDFVEKTQAFLQSGVHVLVVDLFPPTARDPMGIHKAIWDEILEEDFVFPEGKDRILASYQTGIESVAYVEPIAVGDQLRDMPLFLTSDYYVGVPLESTYMAAWSASPEELRIAVETGVMPEIEDD